MWTPHSLSTFLESMPYCCNGVLANRFAQLLAGDVAFFFHAIGCFGRGRPPRPSCSWANRSASKTKKYASR